MIGLTSQQAALLSYIERYHAEHEGVSPSYEEMAEALGLASKSGVHRILTALKSKGRIRSLYGRARSLEVLHEASTLSLYSTEALRAEIARREQLARAA